MHAEATPHVHYALQAIHEAGCSAGLALCPATPVAAASELVADIDVLLCMTVNPGWGGQAFLPGSIAKLERLRALLGPGVAIEVDGGIDAETAGPCAAAGATVFVAGHRGVRRAGPGRRGARDRGGDRGHAADQAPAHSSGTASRMWSVRTGTARLVNNVGHRVLIVDDHPSFRATARVLLEAEGFDVIGEAVDGARR